MSTSFLLSSVIGQCHPEVSSDGSEDNYGETEFLCVCVAYLSPHLSFKAAALA